MGDTFTDDWQDEVPATWKGECGEWQYVGVYNTKREGNKYEYLLSDTDTHIYVWSRSMTKVDLDGVIKAELGSVSVYIRSFSGDWDKTTEAYIPSVRWNSFTDALVALDKKCKEVLDLAKPLIASLAADKNWEAKNPIE